MTLSPASPPADWKASRHRPFEPGRGLSDLELPCPVCGHPSAWSWRAAVPSGGTEYRAIDCPHCRDQIDHEPKDRSQ